MLTILSKIISPINTVVKKSVVLENFDQANNELSTKTIPLIDYTASRISEYNLKVNDLKIIKSVNEKAGYRSITIEDFFNNLSTTCKSMVKLYPELSSLANNTLPELINKETVTVKQAGLMNIGENYAFMAIFIPDFIDYIVNRVGESEVDGYKSNLSKGKIRDIVSASYAFGTVINFYRESKNLVKSIEKTPDVRVESLNKGSFSMMDNKNDLPEFQGFVNNPIYHIRIWWTDREINRYEALEDKVTYLKLKLIDLKMQKDDNPSLDIQKQIDYYESRLEKTENKIKAIIED